MPVVLCNGMTFRSSYSVPCPGKTCPLVRWVFTYSSFAAEVTSFVFNWQVMWKPSCFTHTAKWTQWILWSCACGWLFWWLSHSPCLLCSSRWDKHKPTVVHCVLNLCRYIGWIQMPASPQTLLILEPLTKEVTDMNGLQFHLYFQVKSWGLGLRLRGAFGCRHAVVLLIFHELFRERHVTAKQGRGTW